MSRTKVAVWLFGAIGIVFLIAALIPVLKGGDLKAVFLVLGLVWLVIALASAKKARGGSKGPPAAS